MQTILSKHPPKHPLNLSTFKNLAGSLSASAFTGFYEKFKKLVKAKFEKDDRWPPTWRFAQVIRNSLSHNGRIAFDDPNKAAVHWSGLTISPGTSSSVVMFDLLTPVELILLMMDMDDELKINFTRQELAADGVLANKPRTTFSS